MVLLAITAISSLNTLTQRADRLVSVNYILDNLNEMRAAQLSFEQRREAVFADQLNEASQQTRQLLDENLRHLLDADSQRLLRATQDDLQRYQEQFRQLQAAPANGPKQAQLHDQLLENVHRGLEAINQLISLQNQRSNEESSHSRTLMLALLFCALVLGVLISAVIIRQITLPLRQAVVIARRIGEGDLTPTASELRHDEFGQLLLALEQSGNNLREMLGQASNVTRQLSTAAEELSAITEQTSAGINSQKVETDQVATAMSEMVATVQDVARNAEEASEATRQANSQANQGNQVVQRALAQIGQLAVDIGSSAEAVNQLSTESEHISSVMTVINAVAEQTNLLALNAAIEAARAGDAGRGFAVVADEVRALAKRTQQSTAQIEALIVSLQQGAQKAAQMMHNSHEMVGTTVALANEAGIELQAITQTVTSIQSMNLQIATAAEQQSAVAESINRSVLSVRDVAEQSSTASQQTAASSVELARLGGELQALVARFRV
ncbi:methyl-accepting chemotaxis protein [Pseudomonas alkylphenolica]|uniref:Methyl-accepting chemotaxis protein n=2 Tax=Pseudomonas alkylphenolica TaxID=237609 RepID=A0A443ZHQ6_9PSED|nr:methyl-accepting chemotaxis protein [Pseudomonas alkylphenolica]RWU18317.1 methyl-accepting chemotaxis protein [Pseudomonas alkylphenolica]